jgi:hypothetical protein
MTLGRFVIEPSKLDVTKKETFKINIYFYALFAQVFMVVYVNTY